MSNTARVLGLVIVAGSVAGAASVGGCAAERKTTSELNTMRADVQGAIREFRRQDPGLESWFEDSYGYAVFPAVAKGGAGIGGARGEGLVYEQGVAIGNAVLGQATIGLQLGGQSYRQLIFFEDKRALDEFTAGDFEFSAQASAVAVTAGASADAVFEGGMAVFTVERGGLMFEASIGGQNFDFRRFGD